MADDRTEFAAMGESGAAEAADPGASAGVDVSERPRHAGGLAGLVALLSQNLLLVGMCAAGVGCLYVMSLMKGPQAASATQVLVESTVDDALARLSAMSPASAGAQTTAGIIDTFYYEASHRQIPPDRLNPNPFVLKKPPPPTLVDVASTPRATPAPAQEATELGEAVGLARSLQLQSVLMGSRQTVAIISDNLLTEGQTIRGWTVERILPREVVLRWRDQTFVLKMPE